MKLLRLNVIGYFKDSFWYVKTHGLKTLFKGKYNADLKLQIMPTYAGKKNYVAKAHCYILTNKRDNFIFMPFSWKAIRAPVLLVTVCIPT